MYYNVQGACSVHTRRLWYNTVRETKIYSSVPTRNTTALARQVQSCFCLTNEVFSLLDHIIMYSAII